MTDKTPEDANQAAHRIVNRDIPDNEKLPADIEAAWELWIDQIQNIDGRAFHLLRAAFEAGYEVGTASGAAESGRAGGVKGGKARAKALTPERRSEIAKKAAAKRWGSDAE